MLRPHIGTNPFDYKKFIGKKIRRDVQKGEILKKNHIPCPEFSSATNLTEAKKIAGMAEAHYAMIAPHMYCGPVVFAAAIQLDVSSPNFLIQEANMGPLHKQIFKEPL